MQESVWKSNLHTYLYPTTASADMSGLSSTCSSVAKSRLAHTQIEMKKESNMQMQLCQLECQFASLMVGHFMPHSVVTKNRAHCVKLQFTIIQRQ